MNTVNLKSNLAEAKLGFENENVKVSIATVMPAGTKVSDGKGRGNPLPKGTNKVAIICYKNIKGVSKKFDFYLLTVATSNGDLFDVSVDGGACPPIEGSEPTKMHTVECVWNSKGYPIITFTGVVEPIVAATADSEIKF